jgi:hypothetical protein
MQNKARRTAADTAGRGGQRRPAPAQLPSPKETAFSGALAAAPPAPPAPAPQGPATPLVGGYAKGGTVKKKTSSKGTVQARGYGLAKRGHGPTKLC